MTIKVSTFHFKIHCVCVHTPIRYNPHKITNIQYSRLKSHLIHILLVRTCNGFRVGGIELSIAADVLVKACPNFMFLEPISWLGRTRSEGLA